MPHSALRLGSLLSELTPSAFHRTAIGLTTAAVVGASVLASLPANAQDASLLTKPPAPQTESFTKRECGMFFGTASKVFAGDNERTKRKDTKLGFGYNEAFPSSLAGFMAPSNPAPVLKVIVDGSFSELAKSTNPDDVKLRGEIFNSLTCDGPPSIVAKGNASTLYVVMRRLLIEGKEPVDLHAKGLRVVDPAEVASIQPSVPAALGPRTELVSPKK